MALHGLVRSADTANKAAPAAETDQMTQVSRQRGATGSHDAVTASATRPDTPLRAHQRRDTEPVHSVDVSKMRHLVGLTSTLANLSPSAERLVRLAAGAAVEAPTYREAYEPKQDSRPIRHATEPTTNPRPEPPDSTQTTPTTPPGLHASLNRIRRSPTPRVSDTKRQRVAADYRTGATIAQLAAQYGIHRQTVMRILDQEGVQTRCYVLSQADLPTIRHLRTQGATQRTIAERYGVSRRTVGRYLVRFGVE